MAIHLTRKQQLAVQKSGPCPVEVVDPVSEHAYVLLAREQYDRVRHLLEQSGTGSSSVSLRPSCPIPPGIRCSQEAYWRNLPDLLRRRSPVHRWVAYHGQERVGFGQTSAELYQECQQRGLKEEEIYIDRLEPRPLPPWEAEEVESPFDAHEGTVEPPLPFSL